jgi:hypothetical protein
VAPVAGGQAVVGGRVGGGVAIAGQAGDVRVLAVVGGGPAEGAGVAGGQPLVEAGEFLGEERPVADRRQPGVELSALVVAAVVGDELFQPGGEQ